MSFFAELKRRHVYRVAAFYIIVGWVVLQVVDLFMHLMPLPEWTNRLVFVLLAAGFPVAIVLAWAIDLTPEGIRIDPSANDSNSPRKKRRLDSIAFVALLAMLAYGAWRHDWGNTDAEEPASVAIRSLVVLPLDNLINDPDQAYFVEGMHEALITELSKIDALHVISRTSAMKFQDSDKTVPEIADELGVDAIIEGSVLRAGNSVRVTAQLIEGHSDRHLWADNFDRELTDILALYADVTREIVDRIRVEVTPDEAARLAEHRAVDPAAYEVLLKANFFCGKWAPTEMLQGIELMRQAVLMDPDSALAHAGLAQCLQYAAFFDYVAPADILAEATAAANQAVELNDQSAEAWVSLASVLYYLQFDGAGAESALRKALDINPTDVRALIHYSWQLGEAGRFDDGLDPAEDAIRLDPLSASARTTMALLYYLNGRVEESIALWERVLELDRSDPSSRYYLGLAWEQSGHVGRAIEYHRDAVALSENEPLYLSALAHSYGISGRTIEAQEILETLLEMERQGRAQPYHVATAYLGLGDDEQTIDWLEKGFEAHNSQMVYIKQGPQFESLRGNPRFAALVAQMAW